MTEVQRPAEPVNTQRSVAGLLFAAHESFAHDPQQAVDYAAVAFMRATAVNPEVASGNVLAAHAAHLGLMALQHTEHESYLTELWQNRVRHYGIVYHTVESPYDDAETHSVISSLRVNVSQLRKASGASSELLATLRSIESRAERLLGAPEGNVSSPLAQAREA